MHGPFKSSADHSSQIECQLRHGGTNAAKIVRPVFGPVAKAVWPHKTAAHIAAIANTSERAAGRWLSGEIEPPGIVLAAILTEITKRH